MVGFASNSAPLSVYDVLRVRAEINCLLCSLSCTSEPRTSSSISQRRVSDCVQLVDFVVECRAEVDRKVYCRSPPLELSHFDLLLLVRARGELETEQN